MSEPEATPQPATARPTRSGPGRVLVTVYGIFALAATARSVTQIIMQFHVAPLAYLLSAFSGLVYIVATVTLARGDATSRKIAFVAISTEAVGVITIGTLSFVFPSLFSEPTVWTGYGSGYGFVPLVLPFIGLWWLRHTGRSASAG